MQHCFFLLFLKTYFLAAWNSNGHDESLQQLYDMMPESDFLRNYVCETETAKYKKQTGTKTVLKWKSAGKTIFKYPVIEKEAVYTYCTYEKIEKKFPDIPVGYIVGLNNNLIGLAPDEETVRTVIDGIEALFVVGTAVNAVETVACGASLNFVMAAAHAGYGVACGKGANFLEHIDEEVNKLIGSNEHDCLVGKNAQYFPKSYTKYLDNGKKEEVKLHTNVINEEPEGYKAYPQYSHDNIQPIKNSDVNDEVKILIMKLGE